MARLLRERGRDAEARGWETRTGADFAADLAKGEKGHLRDLALLRLRSGDADAAAALALQDLEEVRHDLETLETVAWTLHRAGRSREALPYLRRALQTGSRDPVLRARAADIHGVALALGSGR